jgi:hypothetical protein
VSASPDGPLLKLDRAKKHIADLEVAIRNFWDSDPYQVVNEPDAESGQDVYIVRVRADPPQELSAIAGDAIHNLRATLDLLVRQLIVANGKTPQKDAFPISDMKSKFDTGGSKSLKGRISSDALKIVRELKPYKGGNDAFWGLHQLDVIDKHRLLLVVGAAFRTMTLTHTAMHPDSTEPLSLDTTLRMNGIFPLKDGDELTRSRLLIQESFGDLAGVTINVEPKFTFDVVLHELGIVETEPLVPLLNKFAGAVDETITLFTPLLT